MNTATVLTLLVGLREDHEGGISPGARLCLAAVDLVAVDGAGIMLMDHHGNATALGLSDDATEIVEDLQFTLGEGPGVDSHTHGRPTLEPDLSAPLGDRWPVFAPAAVNAGFLGAFSFPLRIGAVRFGALDLYRATPGDLTTAQLGDAVAMADIVTRALIEAQVGADPGALVGAVDDHDFRAQVHQAAGMISDQLGIGIADALVRLRAHAYAEGEPVNDVAADVVERRLRLD